MFSSLKRRSPRGQNPTQSEMIVLGILAAKGAATVLVIITELRQRGEHDLNVQLALGRLTGMGFAKWCDAQEGIGGQAVPEDSMITPEGRNFLARNVTATS